MSVCSWERPGQEGQGGTADRPPHGAGALKEPTEDAAVWPALLFILIYITESLSL